MLKETLVSNGSLSNDNLIENSNWTEEPSNLSGRQLLGKFFIGLSIGLIISAILFIALSFAGKFFIDAFQQTSGVSKTNPILPFLLLFIGFIGTFIGNILIAGAYNLFFNKKYYDISKMFSLLLLTNGILFFVLAPIYVVFSKQIDMLFFVLGFHVMFSVFISSNQIEFLNNPNYSASALMGNVLGFSLSILLYSLLRKTTGDGTIQNKVYLLMLLPSIIGYAIIPLGSGIWEKIYYKIYESGSNPLFIASNDGQNDIQQSYQDNSQEDQSNVEM